MKTRFGYLLVATLLLLLAGCASVATQPSTTGTPAGEQKPGEGAIIAPVPKSSMSDNKAVIALLDQAQTDNTSGQREAAGASLERALRIEPRNPWLWLELAQVRLDQGQYAQAITLARKSNSFAGHQSRVQAENWQVIGKARVAQGDSAGAEQAFKLSADLAQQAKAEADRNSGFNLQ
ncbi:MAG: tetratricopeptide repeat protein [Gallionella sp.]